MMDSWPLLLIQISAIYFIMINFFQIILMYLSWKKIKAFIHQDSTNDWENLPPVSFLVPAYNEEALIVETLQTYLHLPHPQKEIVIIDDGSHDKTMNLLKVMFQLKKSNDDHLSFYQSLLHPCLKVVCAPHKGKAAALNFGLMHTKYELICTMDADTIPNARGVKACLIEFSKNKKLIAAGGVIQILPSDKIKNQQPVKESNHSSLHAFQKIEYLRAFICERLGWSYIDATLLISGAFCMIKKKAIMDVGGFRPHSITEDFDLIVRLRKYFKNEVSLFKTLPFTTCYTQAPNDLKHLSRQRMRWQQGLVQTLLQNRSFLLNPQHGKLGFIAFPYYWIVEALSPIMGLLVYLIIPWGLMLGLFTIQTLIMYLLIGMIINIALTFLGTTLDQKYVSNEKRWGFWETIYQSIKMHLGYKQLTYFWRFIAIIKAFRNVSSWGEKNRLELNHLRT